MTTPCLANLYRMSIKIAVQRLLSLLVASLLVNNLEAQTNTFPSSGNAGIGTTSPTYQLDVVDSDAAILRLLSTANGTGSLDGMVLYQNAQNGGINVQDNLALTLATNDTVRMRILSGGNVGIATNTPPQTLSVVGTIGLSETGGTCCRLVFTTSGSGTVINHNDNSPIYFQTESNTWMTILNTGYVGIGTMNPSSKFHVAGDVTVDGNISAKYQDLAEWVPAAQSIGAGSVVVLDKTSDNRVIPSTSPYATHVAGVVSETPGIVLGEAGDGKVKVATTGRVKVRVDATGAPIQRGDLLVEHLHDS